MPVYVFREGNSNIFKIGLTRISDVSPRRRQLNSSSSAGLREFEVIHTETPRELEAFLHRLLVHRNVERHGGKEFFEMMSDNHMREFLRLAQPMFQRNYSAINSVGAFEKLECEAGFRQAAQSDRELLSELQNVETRLREIEDEAVFLRFQKDMIECEIKARIGNSQGIDGIATWESSVRKNFCLELFQERDPEMYQRVLRRFSAPDVSAWRELEPQLYHEVTNRYPKLDKAAWMAQDKAHYTQIQKTHYTPSVSRKFILLA